MGFNEIVLQLLYRCVQAINITHDAVHAQMDVKLRSLICMGLNEQVLHLWLEVLGSSSMLSVPFLGNPVDI